MDDRKLYHQNYYKRNKERIKNRVKLHRYGIDLDEYNQLLKSQGDVCKICKKDESQVNKKLAVDHCHTTGKVRGLLCHNCNTAIGLLKEDVERLKSAMEYLQNG